MFGLATNQLGAIAVALLTAAYFAVQYVPWTIVVDWVRRNLKATEGGVVLLACGLALVLLLGVRLPSLPNVSWPTTTKATAATYVYEKDDHAIPSAVSAALNTLNRQGILATTFEVDTTDGTGDVPDQYKAALAAAKDAGLPTLIVTAGDKVLRVVKNPKSEAEVIGAVDK